MANNYGKYSPGTSPQKDGFRFETGAPLDDRTVVNNKKSLISQTAFTKLTWVFPGMMTVDKETGKLYILKDAENLELLTDAQLDSLSETQVDKIVNKYWVLASADMTAVDDLINEKVATLFQFKGVAYGISLDYTILTVKKISTIIGSESVQLHCIRAEYDLIHNLFYAWAKEDGTVLFYTDTDNISASDTLYTKSSEASDVNYIIYNDIMYIKSEETLKYTKYVPLYIEDELVGSPIYHVTGLGMGTDGKYTFNSDGSGVSLTVTSGEYPGYEFEVLSNPFTITIVNDPSKTTILADSSNNGHVYQIKEDEYASNGATWVQLGSPKTDWIIL